MKESTCNGNQILSDGKRVWVNAVLLVEDEDEDKLYLAATLTEPGYKEIPEDVHDQRLRAAEANRDELMLRTENDFVCANEQGVYFICEEKHSYTRYETQFIPWYVLFDEPAPPTSVMPTLR